MCQNQLGNFLSISLGPGAVGLGWDSGICFSIKVLQKILESQVGEPAALKTHSTYESFQDLCEENVLMVNK